MRNLSCKVVWEKESGRSGQGSLFFSYLTETVDKLLTSVWLIKKQRHYFANKGPSNRSYVFSSSHVWIWELDHEKNWALKNWCFWSVVLKTLESPLDCKEIKPINPEGDQSWIFTGRTDAEAETPILWPLLTNSLEKTLMLGKIEGRRKWLDGITGSMDMS